MAGFDVDSEVLTFKLADTRWRVGLQKSKMMEEQELGGCPECGTQCVADDEGAGSYCPECEETYEKKCSGCGGLMNGDATECSDCFKAKGEKDD